MFRYKDYKKQSKYPYYQFDWWIYFNNKYLLYWELLFRRHIQYGIYGDMKLKFLKLLVFFKLKKPFEDWEISESYFDI
jgi:hypothetical protein